MSDWHETYVRSVARYKAEENKGYDVYDAIDDLAEIRKIPRIITTDDYDAIIDAVKNEPDPMARRHGVHAIIGSLHAWQQSR